MPTAIYLGLFKFSKQVKKTQAKLIIPPWSIHLTVPVSLLAGFVDFNIPLVIYVPANEFQVFYVHFNSIQGQVKKYHTGTLQISDVVL